MDAGQSVTPAQPERSGYAPVNGLDIYYEIHGTGQPLVLLHGAFSAIGTSFGDVLPGLAETRQVIGLEMQAHGRTADIDRPLSLDQMADDTAAVLRHLDIAPADIFGYSMGAAVALRVAIRHPDVVRKLVLASVAYTMDGIHPGLMDGLAEMKPEMMFGSSCDGRGPRRTAALDHPALPRRADAGSARLMAKARRGEHVR
jgi:pimeloyl-ACP methyl ester carboxylesterase